MEVIQDNLFILIFLAISFLSWISSKIKERGQMTYEEEPEPEPIFERPTRTETATRPPAQDPMRQILEALGIPAQEQAAPPPPLPREQAPAPPLLPRPPRQEAPKARVDLLTKEEREALARVQAGKGIVGKRTRSRSQVSARSMLSGHNLQAAFALKEILDKPKSLRVDSHS